MTGICKTVFIVVLTIMLMQINCSVSGVQECPEHTHFVYTDFKTKAGSCFPDGTVDCGEYSVMDGLCVVCVKDFILSYDENGRLCNYEYNMHIIITVFLVLLIVLVLYLAKKWSEYRVVDDYKCKGITAKALATPFIAETPRVDVDELNGI